MSQRTYGALKSAVIDAVESLYDVELDELTSETPPQPGLGDVAFTVAFDLARRARKPPCIIAEELASRLGVLEEVERVEVAGPGYLNVFLDRARYLDAFSAEPDPNAPTEGKIVVEHTNINPNKAAHIGHLRNAALGDTFVRILRYSGDQVEVQNYIDDTGVQVADVVVGFLHLERKDLAEVRAIAESERFDYVCWDLYARVTDYYADLPERQVERENTLRSIEQSTQPAAEMARIVANEIVQCHLKTMERLGVRYDLLPWEGDILRLRFWDHAFELLKQKRAIRLATEGKNAGCWVMDLPDEPGTETGDEKVIVRSNSTVTYVGKDIAYQLWKLGLLERDFYYRPFLSYPDGTTVWTTTSEQTQGEAPRFGHGSRVYNVIDTRQAYLQRIVQQGVALITSEEARERSRHFSYEMVALTPSTCRELGFPVSEEESQKAYIEVSGRKGLGVKADDLIDTLEKKALGEVRERNPDRTEEEQIELARAIARGALRYFMIKYTKNKVIAFDFSEALNFEGDSGPYLQYAMVRANKIVQKMGLPPQPSSISLTKEDVGKLDWSSVPENESDEIWSLVLSSTQLPEVAEQVKRTEEPSHVARFALQLAQKFNAFYHRYPILREEDAAKQALRLFAVQVFRRQMARALDLMGIPIPERM
jgi:arginyl-tRNA synthetase